MLFRKLFRQKTGSDRRARSKERAEGKSSRGERGNRAKIRVGVRRTKAPTVGKCCRNVRLAARNTQSSIFVYIAPTQLAPNAG